MSKRPNVVEMHDSYKKVFSSPDGERVLEHLCRVGFVFDTSHVSGDPYETAHREGQRRLVLSILRFLERDPRELLKQMENINE
jgi:microsomal dipeptidase-like Zn-dependent dipeptidase